MKALPVVAGGDVAGDGDAGALEPKTIALVAEILNILARLDGFSRALGADGDVVA